MPVGTVAATIGAAGIGAAASNSAAKKQAKAITQSSDAAANAQIKTTQMGIDASKEASEKAVAELAPMVDDRSMDLYNRAIGVTPNRQPYDAAFNASVMGTALPESIAAAQRIALSSNAAAGKGGSFNSGKSLQALRDNTFALTSDAQARHLAALGTNIDRSDAARVAKANAYLGHGSIASSLYGASAGNLAQIRANQGVNLSGIYGEQGANTAGFLGAAAGNLANVNWSKAMPNVFGAGRTTAAFKPTITQTVKPFIGPKL